MRTRKPGSDKVFDEKVAVDSRDFHQLPLSFVTRPKQQVWAVLHLPPPPDFVTAPHHHACLGIGSNPDAMVKALHYTRDAHLLGAPGAETRNDRDPIHHYKGLQLGARFEKQGIIYDFRDIEVPLLKVGDVGVGFDEGLVGVEAREDGLGINPGGDGDACYD